MIWQIVPILCLAMFSQYEGRAISEQKVVMKYDKHEAPEHHEDYATAYPSYEFSFKVDDPHTHDIKGQEESRDGDEVKGKYWLLQPDGRKRIVTYHGDKHSGFHAHVEYSGHAHYESADGDSSDNEDQKAHEEKQSENENKD